MTVSGVVAGEPIDERGPIEATNHAPIHSEAPAFTEMSVEQEILVTGIKVVDLLAPYAKGGKIGEWQVGGYGTWPRSDTPRVRALSQVFHSNFARFYDTFLRNSAEDF